MRTLVCDDDQQFALPMTTLLEQNAEKQCVKARIDCAYDPSTALHTDLSLYDLAFLDIDMGSISGFDIARRLRAVREDAILIFVTNYAEFAPEGYEVQAFRF